MEGIPNQSKCSEPTNIPKRGPSWSNKMSGPRESEQNNAEVAIRLPLLRYIAAETDMVGKPRQQAHEMLLTRRKGWSLLKQ